MQHRSFVFQQLRALKPNKTNGGIAQDYCKTAETCVSFDKPFSHKATEPINLYQQISWNMEML